MKMRIKNRPNNSLLRRKKKTQKSHHKRKAESNLNKKAKEVRKNPKE